MTLYGNPAMYGKHRTDTVLDVSLRMEHERIEDEGHQHSSSRQ